MFRVFEAHCLQASHCAARLVDGQIGGLCCLPLLIPINSSFGCIWTNEAIFRSQVIKIFLLTADGWSNASVHQFYDPQPTCRSRNITCVSLHGSNQHADTTGLEQMLINVLHSSTHLHRQTHSAGSVKVFGETWVDFCFLRPAKFIRSCCWLFFLMIFAEVASLQHTDCMCVVKPAEQCTTTTPHYETNVPTGTQMGASVFACYITWALAVKNTDKEDFSPKWSGLTVELQCSECVSTFTQWIKMDDMSPQPSIVQKWSCITVVTSAAIFALVMSFGALSIGIEFQPDI